MRLSDLIKEIEASDMNKLAITASLAAGRTTAKTLLAGLLSLAVSAAFSHNDQGQNNNDQGQNYQGGRPLQAPEIDPAQALGALTLLGGTIAIVRGYRRSKK
jgi:hypothetical protein